MNFMYFIRLSTVSSMKLNFVVDDINLDISYGLIKITSSSSTLSLFDSFFCSISLYSSCIS